jgi:cell division protein ZapB
LTRRSCAFYSAPTVDAELAALEQRIETLIAFLRELRAENSLLRGELLASQERNRDLTARMAQATERLDALIARMPVD